MKNTYQLVISTSTWYSEPTFYWCGEEKDIKSGLRHLEQLIQTGKVKKIYYENT